MSANKIQTEITKSDLPNAPAILTKEAINFLTNLHSNFQSKRLALLEMRSKRQRELDLGYDPDFLTTTQWIRNDPDWKVAPCPKEVLKRHVEITGPTDKKMVINALNSGADVFMADFEDANSPTFENMIEGQANLKEAVAKKLKFTSPEGKVYQLNETTAHLFVRPRGWHLNEKHFLVGNEEISASLFDFGLFAFHNGQVKVNQGSNIYLYLPKMENHLEARLWNEVFNYTEEALKLPKGSIKVTVLIETILAAFEMEEILFELKERCLGLNAGRWDYIFSAIKKFSTREDFVFPDRKEITMAVPFMKAYAETLVRVCHKREAHAMGGMAAFVPSRKDPEINKKALLKVEEDKLREVSQGFDGTWVAHPDLVPVAKKVFETGLASKPHQKDKKLEENEVEVGKLLDFEIPNSSITEEGLRQNISVSLEYLTYWLLGVGAVAIHNLMEDAATAEIARAQVWQWLRRSQAVLKEGPKITLDFVKKILAEEKKVLEKRFNDNEAHKKALNQASICLKELFEKEPFTDFLTSYCYKYLN